jgi:hypothetical protein
VVTDPAEFVANNAKLAGTGRFDSENHLVARMHRNIDVFRQKRPAMLPIKRRQMEAA